MRTQAVLVMLLALMLAAVLQGQPTSQPATLTVKQAQYLLRRPATSAREYYGLNSRQWAVEVLSNSSVITPGDLSGLLADVLPNRDIPSRELILELACERADASAAQQIIESMHTLIEEYIGAREVSHSAKFVQTRLVDQIVVDAFVQKHSKTLAAKMSDQRPLLETFYTCLLTEKMGQYPQLGGGMCKTIATMPARLELRREYVLRLLQNYDFGMHGIPDEIAELCDTTMLPQLRQVVQQSIGNPDAFPYEIARLLADRGDLGALSVMNQAEASLCEEGYLQGHSPEEVAGTCSWRIRIQHPPTTILDWLRRGPFTSGLEYISQNTRIWMITRALELGVGAEDIRTAALQYANQYYEAGHPYRSELPMFKKTGIELSTLHQDDLPNVALPRSSVQIPPPPAPPPESPPVPTSQPWKYWKPNEANYEVMVEWMGSINWDTIEPVEGELLFKEKMCELDLLRPDLCEAL